MEVLTRDKGKVDVADENLLTVPEGLFGFEMYSKYALIDSEYLPFIWLQSCEDSNLAFLIVDPFRICTDYEADIDDETLAKIGVEKPEDIIIMTIVTVPSSGSPITANLQGPLVINKRNRKCMQVVLNDSRWSTKFDIMKALSGKGER